MYLICQLLFGVAKTYSGYPVEAMEILNSLLIELEKTRDGFSENLKRILYIEIFSDFVALNTREYDKYIGGDAVDFTIVKKSFDIVNRFLNKMDNKYHLPFYLQKATYDLWVGDLIKSKDDINILAKKFNQIKHDNRIWGYSEAFLFACENNPSKYEKIINKYEQLKNNKNSALNVQHFIFRYSYDHPNNLGVKIALCALAYYRDDLDFNIIPKTMLEEILTELEQKKLDSVSNLIKDMIKNN